MAPSKMALSRLCIADVVIAFLPFGLWHRQLIRFTPSRGLEAVDAVCADHAGAL
jgi:hypothetical protein